MVNLHGYLAKNAVPAERLRQLSAAGDFDAAVVIPALAEKENLFRTLDCLVHNPAAELAHTLVICVVNNRRIPLVTPDQARNNIETLDRLQAMAQAGEPLRLAIIDSASPGNELHDKGGVGLARKLGLDCAVALLAGNGRQDGLLICLDADTRVEGNYLAALRQAFNEPNAWAGVIDFAHEQPESPEEAAAITCYELFLRYHVLGLEWAASPYAFHTVGSAMACTARAYAAVAGMNRRQAGEDFYFLQQLAKTGPVRKIRETTVHPSPRPSWRVPFGTGQRVGRFLAGGQDEYVLYDPRTYDILKRWLETVRQGLEESAEELLHRAEVICPALRVFLEDSVFDAVWPGLKKNNPDMQKRMAQFHRWFDGFKTIKLLHYLRDNGYPEVEMFEAIRQLSGWAGGPAPALDWSNLKTDLAGQSRLLELLRNC